MQVLSQFEILACESQCLVKLPPFVSAKQSPVTVIDPGKRVRQSLEKMVLLIRFSSPPELGVGVTQDLERFRILWRRLYRFVTPRDGTLPVASRSGRFGQPGHRPVVARKDRKGFVARLHAFVQFSRIDQPVSCHRVIPGDRLGRQIGEGVSDPASFLQQFNGSSHLALELRESRTKRQQIKVFFRAGICLRALRAASS